MPVVVNYILKIYGFGTVVDFYKLIVPTNWKVTEQVNVVKTG